MFVAKKGDTVKIHYTGTLKDGTVFDSSQDKQPLHFIVGQKEVLKGVDQAVIGMVPGETKTVVLAPEVAYGAVKPELIETIAREDLPADLNPKIGNQIEITREDGSLLYVMVTAADDTSITLDANHPLAGRELTFEIHMQEVIPEAEQKKNGMTNMMVEQLKNQRRPN
ncbi:MAG: peptidylprolyl isomerase [Desulfuromonadaceae bacterium]|nr:peptidylprolyl isomerase [Desulfuromonadaceae bacterium]